MKLGLAMFPTDDAVRPAELGRIAEEHGFESLFLPEHTHIPASRRSPYPGGGELPREYSHTYDPFVALATAADATERITLATGICLVVERDPITTAKEVASLDHLSNGRFLFGVGAGWNREEMENHGTDPRRRFSLMRERVEAMKAIWTQDEAEYHGEHVDFDPIWSWPKPVQEPHPPVLIGGNGEKVIDRVVAFGHEWMPNLGLTDPDEGARRWAPGPWRDHRHAGGDRDSHRARPGQQRDRRRASRGLPRLEGGHGAARRVHRDRRRRVLRPWRRDPNHAMAVELRPDRGGGCGQARVLSRRLRAGRALAAEGPRRRRGAGAG